MRLAQAACLPKAESGSGRDAGEGQEVPDRHDRVAVVELDALGGIPAAAVVEERVPVVSEQADDRLADDATAELAQGVAARADLGLFEHVVPERRVLEEPALFKSGVEAVGVVPSQLVLRQGQDAHLGP